jgi:hypothetical protein
VPAQQLPSYAEARAAERLLRRHLVRKAGQQVPAYVDSRIGGQLLRQHRVARVHMPAMVNGYLGLVDGLMNRETVARLRPALEALDGTQAKLTAAVDAIPWYDPSDDEQARVWAMLGNGLESALVGVVESAGAAEVEAQDWPIRFTVRKDAEEIRVPVNERSIRWVERNAAKLLKDVSAKQKRLVRRIILEAFKRGEDPTKILQEIMQVIGLTQREAAAVRNREATILASGVPPRQAAPLVRRYARQLLVLRAKRIARTEFIDGYNQGLIDTWRMAQDEGLLSKRARKDWIEITLSKRTCKICRGLGEGPTKPLGEPFVSEYIGEIDRPPAHPHCRCTMTIHDPTRPRRR